MANIVDVAWEHRDRVIQGVTDWYATTHNEGNPSAPAQLTADAVDSSDDVPELLDLIVDLHAEIKSLREQVAEPDYTADQMAEMQDRVRALESLYEDGS